MTVAAIATGLIPVIGILLLMADLLFLSERQNHCPNGGELKH